MPIPSITDRLYLAAVGRSWRLRQNTERIVTIVNETRRLRIPVVRGLGIDNVYYQRENLHHVLGLLVRCFDGALVDVGANVGQVYVNVLMAGKQCPYIGFEPNLRCCEYLDSFFELNRLQGNAVMPVGLSDRRQVVDLMYTAEADVCASTTIGFRPNSFFEKSKSILLEIGDDVLSERGAEGIGLIKIDVEGGELEVLRGLQATVSRHRPLLLIEVLPHLHIEAGNVQFEKTGKEELRTIAAMRRARTEALEQLLRQLEYSWYRVEANGNLRRLSTLSADGPEQQGEMNFLALHHSRRASFEAIAGSAVQTTEA